MASVKLLKDLILCLMQEIWDKGDKQSTNQGAYFQYDRHGQFTGDNSNVRFDNNEMETQIPKDNRAEDVNKSFNTMFYNHQVYV